MPSFLPWVLQGSYLSPGPARNGGASLSLQKNDAHLTTRDEYSYPRSVEPQIADRLGGVYSPYTCETFGELIETDIEHIVARSEAHDSGLCSASSERKREFARDIRNLTLSAPHLNRNLKGVKDVADWVPEENKCWFAWHVIDVRRAYNLTIDRREADALDAILETCPESSPDTLPACWNLPKEGSQENQ